MAGAYLVYEYPRDVVDPSDIGFELQANFTGPVPEDQDKLKSDVERALVVISAIYRPNDDRFKYYFSRLVSLTQMGLVGATANPSSAQRTLQGLLKEFADKEGAEVKRRYLKSINNATLVILIIILPLAVFFTVFPVVFSGLLNEIMYRYTNYSDYSQSFNVFGNFLFVLCGCVVGIWLSSVAKAGSIDFQRFHVIEEWQINPLTKIIFTSVSAIIFSFFVYKKFIILSIGGISLNSFHEESIVAIIFGALCGLAERAMSSKLTKQAESLFSEKKS